MKKIIMIVLLAVLCIATASALCVDNDGGALSYSPSSVTVNNYEYTDYCLPDGNVAEFTCVDNQLSVEEMPCLLGCHNDWKGNGACVPTGGGSSDVNDVQSSGFETQSFDVESQNEIPEFNSAAAGIAFLASAGAFLFLRKRN
ncbi:MAG: hypothetical protein EPN86_04310 [Nanoarchaeota archaeon]|nr:MAG: hypothetical protein EPN86_04310 [Nanoarchaeota archaeon]